jgi:hypothetical protein
LQARAGVMGGKQIGCSDYEFTKAKEQAKRESFL